MTLTDELAEYAARLRFHDWYYEMSDDPGVYKRGSAEQRWLEEQSRRSDEHRKIFKTAKKRAGTKAGP